MESKQKLVSFVKSPSKDAFVRKGNGFSLKEIKEAGASIESLKKAEIKIDYFRKSNYPENVKILKSIKFSSLEKRKKKDPFVKKEKKRTPFKPKEQKIKKKPKEKLKEEIKEAPPKQIKKIEKKQKVKVARKDKAEPKKLEKSEEIQVPPTGRPLTDLSGLGAATAKKFIELGVNDIEALCKENPEELSTLIKGVSEERIKKWIDEGKDLLQ